MRAFRTTLQGGSGVGPPLVYGCTDPLAINYNPLATAEDGSCIYSITPQTIIVEADGYVHVLAEGQSNMTGSNTDSTGDQTADVDVQAWNYTTNTWQIATLGTAPFFPLDRNNLAFHFCKNLAATYGVKVRTQMVAVGATSINEWYPVSAELSQKMIGERARGNMPKASIFLWHQGEEDVVNGDTQAEYLAKHSGLVQAYKDIGVLYQQAKIIVGETPIQGRPAYDIPMNEWVNAIGSINNDYYACAQGDGIPLEAGNEGHYCGECLQEMGLRYFTLWSELMNLTPGDKNNSLVETTTPPAQPILNPII